MKSAYASLVAVLVATGAAAQTYPTHPVRLIVPFAPGGSNDVMARIIAPHLEQSLGPSRPAILLGISHC